MPKTPNYGAKLPQHLIIQPPTSPNESPSIIELERMREIPIDWVEIMDRTNDVTQFKGVNDNLLGIRKHLEERWASIGLDPAEEFSTFLTALAADGSSEPNPLFRYGTVAVNNPELSEADSKDEQEGFYFTHPSSRLYLPTLSDQVVTPLTKDVLTEKASNYEKLWLYLEDNCVGLEPAWTGINQKQIGERLSSRRYVSREAHLWSKLYFQLKRRIKIGEEITKVADAKVSQNDPHFANVIAQEFGGSSRNGESLDDFIGVHSRFADVAAKAESDLNLLRARISAAGYTLAEKSVKIQHPYTKEETDVAEGQIYKTSHSIVRWSTPYTVWKTRTRRGSCGRRSTYRYPVTKYKAHTAPYTHWELVDLTNDPVRSHITALKESKKDVHVMHSTDDGFVSETGERLENIMLLADLSEDIRLKTVIVFPDYTPVVSDIKNFNGATFFHAPLSGIYPEQFPIISIHEDIGYKLQWTGTELGQLVGSLNLAPGEEREITVSNRFEEEVSETNSYKSTFTSEQSSSSEIASEISTEASREFTKSKSSSKSASLGGSYGPISGNASAKSSSKSTLKLFSKTMKKVARKATSSVSQKKNVEITSSFAKTTRVEQNTSRSTTVKNINSGSTLNLLFHQINNVFMGGLYLNDLRLAVTSGREVIAGSGIFETKVFHLSDLDEALDAIAPSKLPPIIQQFLEAEGTDGDEKEDEIEKRTSKYWSHLLNELVETLEQEYLTQTQASDQTAPKIAHSAIPPVRSNQSVECVCIPGVEYGLKAIFQNTDGSTLNALGTISNIGQAYENLKSLLQVITILEQPLDETRLIVASGGIWMDSAVGQGVALDEYSTQMRDIERQKSLAELESLTESNAFDRSKRIELFKDLTGNSKLVVVLGLSVENEWVRLVLSQPVRHESWRIFTSGTEIVPAQIQMDDSTGNLSFRFDRETLDPNDFENLTLISQTADGTVIAY